MRILILFGMKTGTAKNQKISNIILFNRNALTHFMLGHFYYVVFDYISFIIS